MNVESMMKRLNPVIRGWANYFRIANCKSLLFKTLRRLGYKGEYRKISMTRWRNSNSPLMHLAIPNTWFDDNGLVNLDTYETGILSHY